MQILPLRSVRELAEKLYWVIWFLKSDFVLALTVLAVLSGESVPADTLVSVQLGVAAAFVLTNGLKAGMVRIHGHVGGRKGIVSFQDWNSHQSNLWRPICD